MVGGADVGARVWGWTTEKEVGGDWVGTARVEALVSEVVRS